MGLRTFGWTALGIVLGFLLASMRMERERDALQARVDDLERRLESTPQRSFLDTFLPRLARREAEHAPPRGPTAAGTAEGARPLPPTGLPAPKDDWDPRPAGGSGGVTIIGSAEPAGGRRHPTGDDTAAAEWAPEPDQAPEREGGSGARAAIALRERFDDLASLQRARAAASRAALIEQAGLDEAQAAQVDATFKKMNDELSGYADEMLDHMTREEQPTPAEALGLGHDVSGILYEGQRDLDAIVGDAAEHVDPSALEAWNYVDIESWRPFVEEHAAGAEPTASDGAPSPREP